MVKPAQAAQSPPALPEPLRSKADLGLSRRGFLQHLPALGLAAGPTWARAHGAAHGGSAGRAPVISAAWAPDGRLWVVGVDAHRRLFVQSRGVSDSEWTPRRALDLKGEPIEAGGQSRPKIAFGPQGWVVIAWTRPGARAYTGDIRLMRSEDGGQHFAAPRTVHHDQRPIGHRFEALAFDAEGALHVLWIDKRESLGPPPKAPGAAIYRTVSMDGGRHFMPEVRLAQGSCECCRIALAHDAQGRVAALWRHVWPGGVRDHAWARLGPLDAPAPVPVRASLDGWQLDACPHHGPSLAAAADGGWHAVWWGERAGVRAVRYGRLTAAGAPVGAPLDLPDPHAEHAVVAAWGARVVIAWRSFDGQSACVRMGRSDDDGAHWSWRDALTTRGDLDLPQCVVGAGRMALVWATEDMIHVEEV